MTLAIAAGGTQENDVSKPDNTHRLVILTDLDGSLLDHHTYSHEVADPLLKQLREQGVPVVLCTSKTRAEVESLRTELDNQHPFIVENGAAVFVPTGVFDAQPADTRTAGEYWVKEFCPPREHWLKLLEEARSEFDGAFENFAGMSSSRVAQLTGLPEQLALQAQARGYGEPVKWQADDAELQRFNRWFEARGARVLRGGRFVHVAGQSDKGRALRWLVEQYQRQWPRHRVIALALGDGHNDVDMLRSADLGVVIRSPVHDPPVVEGQSRVYTTEALGPAGWVEGFEYWMQWLDRHSKNQTQQSTKGS